MNQPMHHEAAPQRWWTVDIDNPEHPGRGIHDLDTAERVCQAALALLRPRLTAVVIDAYTDYRKQLKRSPRAAAAQDELRELGALRGRGDPGMQVRLDPVRKEDWTMLVNYAAWSINVDLYTGPEQVPSGGFDDCGHSIVVLLTEDESRQLAERVGPLLSVNPSAAPPG